MLQLSERTLGDWLEHWAEVTPDKEYIVYSDRNLRFTWKQFNERVDKESWQVSTPTSIATAENRSPLQGMKHISAF
jgi:hypothetical protein